MNDSSLHFCDLSKSPGTYCLVWPKVRYSPPSYPKLSKEFRNISFSFEHMFNRFSKFKARFSHWAFSNPSVVSLPDMFFLVLSKLWCLFTKNCVILIFISEIGLQMALVSSWNNNYCYNWLVQIISTNDNVSFRKRKKMATVI